MVVDVVNDRFMIGKYRFHLSIFKDENDQPEQVSVVLAEGEDPVSNFLPALGMLITLCLQNKVPVTDLVRQMSRFPGNVHTHLALFSRLNKCVQICLKT